jgi:hypothetical protein
MFITHKEGCEKPSHDHTVSNGEGDHATIVNRDWEGENQGHVLSKTPSSNQPIKRVKFGSN